MSARVRWRTRARYDARARELVRDGVRMGVAYPSWGGMIGSAAVVAWRARDYADGTLRPFRRRSDAKRWLLARAAGLAEVPTARKPRGWRGTLSADLDSMAYERDRRRR